MGIFEWDTGSLDYSSSVSEPDNSGSRGHDFSLHKA